MKKKGIVLLLCLLLFSYFVVVKEKNRSFPKNQTIESVSLQESLVTEPFTISVEKRDIQEYVDAYPILTVVFRITNTSQGDLDLRDFASKAVLYQDFNAAYIVNIKRQEGDFVDKHFSNAYSPDDFLFRTGESKELALKYFLEKEEKAYSNQIFLDTSYYEGAFQKHLKDGTLLYKTINLGDVYQ